MSMNEGAISAPSDATVSASGSATTAVDTSATTGTSSAPTEQPSGTASAGSVQDTQTTATDDDVLAGVPSIEEINQLPDDARFKKSLLQMRTAIDEKFKPQLSEFTEKFKPLEPFIPHLERFEKPEQLQELVNLQESLFGYTRDDSNQLVPATDQFAQNLTQRDPLVADYLAADLMNGTTRTDDGREVSRINYALEAISADPARRAEALRILGGVEPGSIAPTWQPSAEELAVINPELQDIYKQLPYDKRENLKLNDPAFINEYLEEQKFKQDLIAQNQQAQELQNRQQQQREQYIQQKAQEAANQTVEQGFRTGLAEFAKSVVDSSQFIKPLDPQSLEAKAMAPEQVQAHNQQAQRVNQGVGSIMAAVVAALSVPDTAWAMEATLKELGVDESVLQKFNQARMQFANNTRDYGELNFLATAAPGGQIPPGLGGLQTNSAQAMKAMKGYANLIVQPLKKLMSDYFELKATGYNSTLNTTGSVRPQVNGSNFDRTTTQTQLPAGKMTRQEIERLYG